MGGKKKKARKTTTTKQKIVKLKINSPDFITS